MADQQQQVPQLEQEEGQAVVVTHVLPEPVDDKSTPLPPPPPIVVEKEPLPVPETEEESVKPAKLPGDDDHTTGASHEASKPSSEGDDNDSNKNPVSDSVKEDESTNISHFSDFEKKAIEELKQLVQEALKKHEFSNSTSALTAKQEQKETEETKKAGEAEQAIEVAAEKKVDVPAEIGEEKNDQEKAAPPAAITDDNADDDDAKTVEAIEETIVAVSSSVSQEQSLPQKEESEAAKTDSSETKQFQNDQDLPEEVSIWGIKLLEDERSDVILLKFLRARDFKVKEAFTMLKNTIRWRKEFGIDELIEQELDGDHDLEKVVFMHGFDKEGHPVCYNVYGEFQSKELYEKTFSDQEKRQRFLRWRIQFLEKSIRKLDLSPGGISTIVQVNDLKNSPGPAKKELRQATSQALQLLQDNYPEFVEKQIFINVPWWYLTVNRMISPFLTQRTKSKFVFAGPSKSAETLLRYIAAEQIPVKYGGLSKDGEFGTTDTVTEISVKPAEKHTVEFPVVEKSVVTWEVRVVGWEVRYGAEFVPAAEDSYAVIIQKTRQVGGNEETVICSNFRNVEAGKLVLTIDNTSSKKKKKLLYRLKSKSASQ